MSSTYSINPGQVTEATKLVDLNSVLEKIPDNTSKLIDPHDLRDGIYTAWENIMFKPTTGSASVEYIGIDRSDFYEKIFLGKKKIAGNDVLDSNLLNSDVDLFIFNTKTDSDLTQQNTRVGFLAGASTSVFYYGNTMSIPYFETKVVTTASGNVLDFNLTNNSYITTGSTNTGGNISIKSTYGNVLINGLIFPTLTENATVANDAVLKYNKVGSDYYLEWGTFSTSVEDINTSGTFSITANPLLINGYDAMFSSPYQTATAVGGIDAGSTFSNVAVTEVLRQLLYPYTAPAISMSIGNNYVEVSNQVQTINFSYSITKIVGSTTISTIDTTPIFITDTSTPLTYLNVATPNRVYESSASYSSSSYFNSVGAKGFTLSVNDNQGTTSSAVLSVEAVYPVFYGVSTTASATQSVVQSLLGSFTKLVNSTIEQTVPMTGDGVCLYYLVPEIYNTTGSMSALYDSNAPALNINTVFRGNGTPFTMSLNSPSSPSHWSGVIYNCYIYSPAGYPTVTTIGIPTLYNANYQFVF